ncbi:MAG: bifunctional (p)ppGpp synthetase/guanosine-3',5'-bis(diphosphate) 3'-pyrophosphohydrolase [Tidjanibacter sp.]|nr:bifunctional (p)ppGpp synthetase/guanosine-3',5'-bis(diphosphate) 3'-pyrophosphohydrolase [Tidjanibacter sp.]
MEKQWLRERYSEFYAKAEQRFSERSLGFIYRAIERTAEALDGMTRYDGSPLLDHSMGTALVVFDEIGLGRNSTVSTILHDAYRMGLIGADEVRTSFGDTPITLLEGMNHISGIETNSSSKQADNFREMIISYSTDPRVILIKLADRLEVMRRLEIFPEPKRRKKSWESMNLYAQIAHKLGLYAIKSELEDLSLRYLEPVEYHEISQKLTESEAERMAFIGRFLEPIEKKLAATGMKYHIKSRTKSIYSIWRKMHRQHIPFEEVFDLFAIRIIIDCPPEQEKQSCWGVFSIVTDFYIPNPERMRDWISIPKSNGYESLHTTVVTKEGKWVEIQIRTERMDEVAERGIAAHWRYKGVEQSEAGQEEWLAKLRSLMEETDRSHLATRLGTKLTSSEVFVFTPKGDLRKLPEGATVLDFAFDIHSDVGSKCIGARIGEKVVPIKEVLRNGDIVNILTAKNQKPKSDWLSIAKTSKARNRIKVFLREEEAKLARLGREELERKLKNWKVPMTIDEAVAVLCKYYKIRNGLDLYGRIATEKLSMSDIKEILGRHVEGELFEPKPPAPRNTPATQKEQDGGNRQSETLIIGEAIKGLDYKMARCCNPIFGDEVFGFTTISSGITIHREDCPNAPRLKEMYPYRIISAKWRSDAPQGAYVASIRVVADDATGMVNRLMEVITSELKLNIRSLSFSPARDNNISGLINIEVPNTNVVDMVVFRLLKIKGVERAYRIN